MIFRIYWKKLGDHVHMRVFGGKQEGNLGKCGDLVMRIHEFEEFAKRLDAIVQFIEE